MGGEIPPTSGKLFRTMSVSTENFDIGGGSTKKFNMGGEPFITSEGGGVSNNSNKTNTV